MLFVYATTALFLIISLFPLPLEFYSLLRIVVSIGSILGIVDMLKTGEEKVKVKAIIFFLFFLIMYNPIEPFYFANKLSWVILDLNGIAIFSVLVWLKIKKSKEKPDLKRSSRL